MAKQANWLKLQVGSSAHPVSAEGFLQFLESALAVLGELDREQSHFGSPEFDWEIVEVGHGSPIHVTFQPTRLPAPHKAHGAANGKAGRDIIDFFAAGMSHLNESNTAPRRFTAGVLGRAKRMASIAMRYQLNPVIFTPTQRRVELRESAPGNIDWVIKRQELKKKPYIEHGSLEGELQKLSGSTARTRDRLSLFDRVLDEYVPCYFSSRSKDLEATARSAWKRRVRVSGKISVSYQSQRPDRIDVESIEILPHRDELPRLADLPQVNITDGMEEAEYVRKLRDAL